MNRSHRTAASVPPRALASLTRLVSTLLAGACLFVPGSKLRASEVTEPVAIPNSLTPIPSMAASVADPGVIETGQLALRRTGS